jgi:Skp family chaperone for outer membrane proteins
MEPPSYRPFHLAAKVHTRRAVALLTLAGLFTLGSAGLLAQQPMPKIAVVDLDLVFLQSEIGKVLQTELRKLEESTRARLDTELSAMDELQQRAVTATPEQRRDLQRQREDRELSARRIRDDATRQAQKMEQESRQRYSEKMEPLFRALQQEQGWDLILNKAGGLVIFAGESLDVTSLVMERLNAGG